MPADLAVEGSHEVARIARRLKAYGDGELRRELFRGLNRATKPLKEAAKQAARADLPRRGGLNEFVAQSSFSTRTRATGKNPGVRLVAAKKKNGGTTDLRKIDQGRLRHPVFGNQKVWVLQDVRPGWFTDTLNQHADDVRIELLRVLDDVARRIERG